MRNNKHNYKLWHLIQKKNFSKYSLWSAVTYYLININFIIALCM